MRFALTALILSVAIVCSAEANSLRQYVPADNTSLKEPQKPDAKAPAMEDLLSDFTTPVKPPKSLGEKPKSDLVIPKETTKTDFLIGHWRCHMGLVSERTGEPIMLDFYFGKDGLGSTVLQESKTKHVYEGTAYATLKDGLLKIESSVLSTPQSLIKYTASSIRCRQQGDTAVCDGKNGKTSWSDVTFERIE